MTLAEQLLELHRSLARKRIPHAFGGAISLGYWTINPRGTSDLDVNVFVPAEKPERALAALPDGVEVPDRTAETVIRDGQIRLWWDGTPVDLFFDSVAIHERAKANRKTVTFEGTKIPILGPVELATFKAMFDRTQHWADIEAMIEAGMLDLDAVRKELRELLPRNDLRFARLDEAVRRAS